MDAPDGPPRTGRTRGTGGTPRPGRTDRTGSPRGTGGSTRTGGTGQQTVLFLFSLRDKRIQGLAHHGTHAPKPALFAVFRG